MSLLRPVRARRVCIQQELAGKALWRLRTPKAPSVDGLLHPFARFVGELHGVADRYGGNGRGTLRCAAHDGRDGVVGDERSGSVVHQDDRTCFREGVHTAMHRLCPRRPACDEAASIICCFTKPYRRPPERIFRKGDDDLGHRGMRREWTKRAQ